jgi:dUTP pyrophosphatase
MNCGKEFTGGKQRLENKTITCSRQCSSEYIKSLSDLNAECPVCNKKFHIKPSHLKRFKNVCCSWECNLQLRSKNMSNEGNHQYGVKGELNGSYISDIKLTTYGYLALRNNLHPFAAYDGFVAMHRLVMEEYLRDHEPDSEYLIKVEGFQDRFLDPDIVVHHKNQIKNDNRISNLEIMDLRDHMSYHNNIRNYHRNEKGQFDNSCKYTKKTFSGITPLFKKYSTDAGHDISSNENSIIPPGESKVIKTGIQIEIPEGHVCLIWSRSGLSVKNKIEVGAGCVDSSYRGEIMVHLYNFNNIPFEIKKGDRIAQMLVIPINLAQFFETDLLNSGERDTNGFGSTGKGVL